jgi:hypothetical protein
LKTREQKRWVIILLEKGYFTKKSITLVSKPAAMKSIPASIKNHPKIKFLQQRFEHTVQLAMEKAAAHLKNPQQYPLPAANANSLEQAFCKLVNALPNKRQHLFLEKMETGLNSSLAARQQKYGDLALVNLTSNQPVLEQVKNLDLPAAIKISEQDLQQMETEIFPERKPFLFKQPGKQQPTPKAATFATKLNFIVESLVCHKTNDIHKDEILLGAFGTDSAGIAASVNPFLAGKFKKGETVSLGDKGNLFRFTIGDGLGGGVFPESFTAGIFIIEKDLIHSQELSDNLALVFSLIGEVLIGIAFVLLFIPGVPKILLFIIGGIGLGFNFLGHFVIPIITDDFAEPATDSFLLNEPPRPGEFFVRTFDFSINTSTGLTRGSYTANVKWVVE